MIEFIPKWWRAKSTARMVFMPVNWSSLVLETGLRSCEGEASLNRMPCLFHCKCTYLYMVGFQAECDINHTNHPMGKAPCFGSFCFTHQPHVEMIYRPQGQAILVALLSTFRSKPLGVFWDGKPPKFAAGMWLPSLMECRLRMQRNLYMCIYIYVSYFDMMCYDIM